MTYATLKSISVNEPAPSLYDFEDYRAYLHAYYDYHKRNTPNFSFRSFARRAQLQAPNYLKQVLSGDRPVTTENLEQFARGLEINADETEYFKYLIRLEKVTNELDQQRIREQLKVLRTNRFRSELAEKHYDLFSNWAAWAIRELVFLEDFKPEGKYISQKLRGRIGAHEASELLETLIQNGHLVSRDNRWMPDKPLIATADNVVSKAIRKVNCEMLQMGIEAIENDPPEIRETGGITLPIAKSDFPAIQEKIRDFRKRLNLLFSKEKGADTVIQINMLAHFLTGDGE